MLPTADTPALAEAKVTVLLSNDTYSLVGGFWGGSATQYRIYLPLILKQ